MREALAAANLALAFALELAMLAAFGWAAVQAGGWLGWTLAAAAVAAAIALWAWLAAPKSRHRLRQPWLVLFKIAMFGGATLALAVAGAPGAALSFAAVAVLNLGLSRSFGQS